MSAAVGSGPHTTEPKSAALTERVTLRFEGATPAPGHSVCVEVAIRAESGLWGPFLSAREAEPGKDGVAYFALAYPDPTWVSVRGYACGVLAPDRWSQALEARWQ